jgi:hypothetical protein
MKYFFSFLFVLALGGCCTAPSSKTPPTLIDTSLGAPAVVAWRGLHEHVQTDKELDALEKQLPVLAADGVNVFVIQVDYGFDFQSHPELRYRYYITKAKAREFTAAARRVGIQVIPELDCLGHQSGGTNTYPLLVKYPQLDETPGQFPNNKGIYCRSWCSENPDVYKIVFPLIDELADAFQANAFHVGMDEVFIIGDKSSPLDHDQDTAKLFADCVNKLHQHIVGERRMQMLMWGDRLLNAWTMGNHMYEESMNGTWPAVDMIPKDIIICDWHYDYHTNYPSVPFLLDKGFRVWPCGFQPLDATKQFSQFSLEQRENNKNVIGYLATTWSYAYRTNITITTWPPITQILPAWKDK